MHKLYNCSLRVPDAGESELAPLQKAQKSIIQPLIRSKMAIVPFLFGNSALIYQDSLLEIPERTW